MKLRSAFAFLALVPLALAQQTGKPDDHAKFLGGLSVAGTALENLSEDTGWKRHAKESDAAWSEFDARQLSKIREWSQQELPEAAAEKGPLFYMFSGPDMLHAQTFFPNASVTLLSGLEPVGAIPDVTTVPRASLGGALSNLRNSINTVLAFSFFRTKDMKVDLQATQLNGTLPVIYIFLARTGCSIESVDLVSLNDAGELVTEKGATQGAKIIFTRKGGLKQTAYYFTTDLSNEGIRKHKGFITFCGSFGKGAGFTKAASYLMHNSYFSDVRDFLLASSSTLVQDDSGIPVKHFNPDQWYLRYFGNYPGPIEMFKDRYQPDMAAAYKSATTAPLPFSFGYRWHTRESSLIAAINLKAIPKALPVTE